MSLHRPDAGAAALHLHVDQAARQPANAARTAGALDAAAQTLDPLADAFGPVQLTTFAMRPSGAHLFRAQHGQLARLMASILDSCEREVTDESAVAARSALTTLLVRLPMHQRLEDQLLHVALAADARSRMLAEQFEREMVPLLAELASVARRYPSASSVLNAARGELAAACVGLFSRIQERFRREERDIFPSYERVLRSAPTLPAAA